MCKINTLIISILFSINCFAEGLGSKAINKAFNQKEFNKSEKKMEKIPVKISIGLGLSQYKLFDVYNKPDGGVERIPTVLGTEINLSGVVDKKQIKRFQRKIPLKYRKLALSLNEVSATHLYIPKTLYIQPRNSSGIEAYGASWGLVPEIGIGTSFASFVIGGGLIATYLHYRDFNKSEVIHFIRPGLRGKIGVQIPMFWNSFILEVGGKGDVYVPQKFYGDKSLWNVRGIYALFHFRIPHTIEAKI